MSAAYWLNTAWMMSGAGEARAFRHAARNVRKSQAQLLRRLVRRNQASWYGRRYDFARIKTVDDYQQRVPLTSYDQLRQPIDRIARGESGVLTSEPVMLLEPTGGSTSAEKLIPYTRSLRKEFQRALAAWMFDVMQQFPAARRGRAYWSISPMAQTGRISAGGIPVGFEEDRDYLGFCQRWAASQLLVVPPHLRKLRSIENARYVTLLYLLARADLALISVWSPTFLSALVSNLPNCWEAICADLRLGHARLPKPGDESADRQFTWRRATRRAEELHRIFSDSAGFPEQLAACWPQLAFISCWADASSAMYVPQLRNLFPQATLQPKGLLATEGVVSFPLVPANGCVLSLRSHFFEFIDVTGRNGTDSGTVHLVDEIHSKRRYRVVLTTGGGLYRYDMEDEIEVVDWYHDCPVVRFCGRSRLVSDLVGEKLHEQHVRSAIQTACSEIGIEARFALLAPTHPAPNSPARYCLYLECRLSIDTSHRRKLADRLEEQLRANPQYRTAVDSGQLHPVDVFLIESDAWMAYERVRVGGGQKPGDIKATALDPGTGWSDVFAR